MSIVQATDSSKSNARNWYLERSRCFYYIIPTIPSVFDRKKEDRVPSQEFFEVDATRKAMFSDEYCFDDGEVVQLLIKVIFY